MQTPSKFVLSDRHECLSLISCSRPSPGANPEDGKNRAVMFKSTPRSIIPNPALLLDYTPMMLNWPDTTVVLSYMD
jgi:hypothetical protein